MDFCKIFELENGRIETIFRFLDALNRDNIREENFMKKMVEYEPKTR